MVSQVSGAYLVFSFGNVIRMFQFEGASGLVLGFIFENKFFENDFYLQFLLDTSLGLD